MIKGVKMVTFFVFYLDRRASLKRSFDGEDEEASVAKKSRTDAKEAIQNEVENTTPEKCQKKADKPLATLLSLASFMQDKKQSRRMTIHDLEQFALLKVCEALVDNSELGDARHHIKMQEQLLESMRKEMQQLSKQVRDLEIVNKKLMNDVKQHQQGLTQKPLNPLRITRSVGLQVKFTSTIENTVRRKAQNVVLTTGGKFHTLGCILNTSRNRNIPNTTSPGVTTKNVQVGDLFCTSEYFIFYFFFIDKSTKTSSTNYNNNNTNSSCSNSNYNNPKTNRSFIISSVTKSK